MATTTFGPTYDPQSTATALAQKYTQAAQQTLTSKTNRANAVQKGLSELRSALTLFQGTLGSLTGVNKRLFAQSATLSDTTLGTASANASASAGTYHFFVEQVATAHQVQYNNIPDNVQEAAGAGTLKIKVGPTTTISVDLSTANSDSDTKLTVREIATAINKAAGNAGLVSASVVTVGGVPRMMLSSQNTGTAGAITLDTTSLGATLKTAFDDPANFKEVTAAKDAKVWLGAKPADPLDTTNLLTQSSNTFTNIDGVSVTFTKAQASGATPVTLTVAPDSTATTKNVQEFIDAYNKLKAAVDKLVDPGDPDKGVAAGPFAHDAGIRALRDHLVDLMRPTGGATNLAMYGITGSKGGGLQLKTEDLFKQLAKDPFGLDNLIGNSSLSAPTGIAGKLNTYLKEWSDTSNGKIKIRSTENEKLQKDLAKRQDRLDAQYDTAYERYLLQFTRLQNMQNQMSNNATMFDALFGSKK